MEGRTTRLWTSADANEASMKAIPFLLLLMTVTAGAIIALAFQRWVDFGFVEIRGTKADAATGISDGWFVAGLASAILLLIGAVLFRQRLAPVLLPMIALAAVCTFGISGFDAVTNWHAAVLDPGNPGILVQAQGDPTIVLYAISALSIVIAVSAAAVRSIQLRAARRMLQDPTADENAL